MRSAAHDANWKRTIRRNVDDRRSSSYRWRGVYGRDFRSSPIWLPLRDPFCCDFHKRRRSPSVGRCCRGENEREIFRRGIERRFTFVSKWFPRISIRPFPISSLRPRTTFVRRYSPRLRSLRSNRADRRSTTKAKSSSEGHSCRPKCPFPTVDWTLKRRKSWRENETIERLFTRWIEIGDVLQTFLRSTGENFDQRFFVRSRAFNRSTQFSTIVLHRRVEKILQNFAEIARCITFDIIGEILRRREKTSDFVTPKFHRRSTTNFAEHHFVFVADLHALIAASIAEGMDEHLLISAETFDRFVQILTI